MFSNLDSCNYFCHMTINDEEIKVREVKDFSAYILDKINVVYTFFVPCEVKIEINYKTINLSVYDDTYYIAVKTPINDSVQVENINRDNCSWKVFENLKKPYYYGDLMVWSQTKKKWYVIDKSGDWLEFAGEKEEIKWQIEE